ncbi:hypothetical protein C1H46_043719 [Malus baccata]|uniref:Embryo surrounding factor 1 brassicaceae domain-containing protein n=1 Tax=Malus baccata TaxID=106549 RepID=A0A540K9Y7_MALBA|nr:hypothetical protein C1H46_043719 [Malus baccata]
MAIKLQLVLFCMVFIALLALAQCDEGIGISSNKKDIVVENLRVKGDGENLTFCSQETCSSGTGSGTKICFCCAFFTMCWDTLEECKAKCHP